MFHFCLKVLDYAKRILLWCATPDAVFRVSNSRLSADEHGIIDIYFEEQHHESVLDYIQHQIKEIQPKSLYAQVKLSAKFFKMSGE